jgi:hypothetical protein
MSAFCHDEVARCDQDLLGCQRDINATSHGSKDGLQTCNSYQRAYDHVGFFVRREFAESVGSMQDFRSTWRPECALLGGVCIGDGDLSDPEPGRLFEQTIHVAPGRQSYDFERFRQRLNHLQGVFTD